MELYFKINRTLIQKFQEQYVISAADTRATLSQANFDETFDSRDEVERVFYPRPGTLAKARNPNGVIVVFGEVAEGSKSVSTVEVDRMIKKLIATKASTMYLINAGPMSHVAGKRITELEGLYRVVIFRTDELIFNVTANLRVPVHQLLSPVEARLWLEETKLKRSQLPRIFENDPQVKYLDGISGDLVRVIRPSPTAGSFIHHMTVARRLIK